MRVPTSRARGNGPASTSRPRMVSSLGKQAEDLRGVIHKRVGWGVALIHDPAVTAAVGVNAATDEVLGGRSTIRRCHGASVISRKWFRPGPWWGEDVCQRLKEEVTTTR